jgi:hypothetical protein
MAINWDSATTRLSARGPDGELLSFITGHETEAELRVLVVRFVHECPIGQQHPGCPFRSLQNLYHASLQTLLNGMNHKSLAGLFELEREARNAGNNET